MSQWLIFKASCIEVRTSHKTWSYLYYQTKIQISKRGKERFLRRKGRKKSHIQTYPRYSSSAYKIFFLFVRFFFSFSFFNFLSLFSLLCVYLLSFSVSAFLFFSSTHFCLLKAPLIYRGAGGAGKPLSPIFFC